MVAVLVVGVVTTFTFYYFSGTKRSFSHGHIFVLVTYIGFVFVLIADYAKRVDLVPKKYRQQLKENKLHGLELHVRLLQVQMPRAHREHVQYHYLDYKNNDMCRNLPDWNVSANANFFKVLPTPGFDENEKDSKKKTATKKISNTRRTRSTSTTFSSRPRSTAARATIPQRLREHREHEPAILMGCRFSTLRCTPSTARRASPRRPIRITSTSKSRLTTSTWTTPGHVKEAMTVKGCKNYTDPPFLHFRGSARGPKRLF